VIHIVGRGKKIEGSFDPFYRQYEFLLDEMKFAYAIADLAVCRAGASSIFELAAARIPMLLVPLGLHQSRGDQIINANIFVKKGWAESCEESSLTPERLTEAIERMLSQKTVLVDKLEQAPSSKTAVGVGQVLVSVLRGKAHGSLTSGQLGELSET
jgi:UDP-N-acetylglucosamine--N-acetylmuramyl-(pentapeptide) pyrophosphoryl-undecaprenol N-acetylglucosamine transferase